MLHRLAYNDIMQHVKIISSEPFQPGDAVRSLQFGLGRVVIGGDTPVIRFLCGIERSVSHETLDIVPEQQFRDAVASAAAVEMVTHLRVADAGTAKWVACGIRRQLGGFLTDATDETAHDP